MHYYAPKHYTCTLITQRSVTLLGFNFYHDVGKFLTSISPLPKYWLADCQLMSINMYDKIKWYRSNIQHFVRVRLIRTAGVTRSKTVQAGKSSMSHVLCDSAKIRDLAVSVQTGSQLQLPVDQYLLCTLLFLLFFPQMISQKVKLPCIFLLRHMGFSVCAGHFLHTFGFISYSINILS